MDFLYKELKWLCVAMSHKEKKHYAIIKTNSWYCIEEVQDKEEYTMYFCDHKWWFFIRIQLYPVCDWTRVWLEGDATTDRRPSSSDLINAYKNEVKEELKEISK